MQTVDTNPAKSAAWTSVRAVGAALLSASLVSGCATVQSKPKLPSDALTDKSAGFNYFLPRKLVKLTISREPVNLAKLKQARDNAAAKLDMATETASEKEAEAERQKGLLDALSADAEARADQVKAAEMASAALTLANSAVSKAETSLTEAASNYFSALNSDQESECAYKAKLELQPAQADPDHRFSAKLHHNWLRDDKIKLAVNPAGLLTSANIVAADRTADILVELAGAVSGTGSSDKGALIAMEKRTATCGDPRSIVLIFDPTDRSELANVAKSLELAGYPYRVGTNTSAPPVSETKPLTELKAEDEAKAREAAGADRKAALDIYHRHTGGIFYRSPVPVPLTLERHIGKDWHIVDAAMVQLPQAGPISYIPTNASAFVKTVDDVVFVDGAIASWSPERPSEALEIFRLPVKAASAVISVPAQLLSLRVDYSSKAKTLADQQADQMAATQTLSVLRKCLNDAKVAGSDGLACLPKP